MDEKSKEKSNGAATVGKSQIVMLSAFFLVMLFICAFSCYSCSYQSPLTPLDEGEGRAVLTRLAGSSWTLDATEGETTLPELGELVITGLVFEDELAADGTLEVSVGVKGKLPIQGALLRDEAGSIILFFDEVETPVRVSWSSSKDGRSETITFRGGDSNRQCYFLKI